MEGTDPRSFQLHGAPENVDGTKRELQETVHGKLRPLMLEYAMRYGGGRSEYAMFIDLAEQGSAEAAYMAGIACRHRLQVGTEFARLGVLDTDKLAFKYFQQSANGGIGLGMQSLADLYFNGQGVRKNRVTSCDWLWNACLIHSVKAYEVLDSRTMIPLELNSTIENLSHTANRVPYGSPVGMGGPNLAALLQKLGIGDGNLPDCLLPPFAAATPTLTVGGQARPGTTGHVLVTGAIKLQELGNLLCFLSDTWGHSVNFTYGRRGTCKSATAQTYGGDTREKDSYYYQIPPLAQCDETVSDDDVNAYIDVLRDVAFEVLCVHGEASGDGSDVVCMSCVEAARNRLEATSHGRVALSHVEILPARGLTAAWKDANGGWNSDTYKTYCRADVESVLGALVVC